MTCRTRRSSTSRTRRSPTTSASRSTGRRLPGAAPRLCTPPTRQRCPTRRAASTSCSPTRGRNPGRVTYPAPPDFTGTSFVKQAVIAMGEDDAFEYLAELQPLSLAGRREVPEVGGGAERALRQRPGRLRDVVRSELHRRRGPDGSVPALDPSVPARGGRAGQRLLRDDPRRRRERGRCPGPRQPAARSRAAGDQGGRRNASAFPAFSIKIASTRPSGRPSMRSRPSPYLLDDLGETKEELPAADVAPLEKRWQQEILR